jgi:uncharacterized secreted protein with C-terminal beta-propeller domain
VKKVLLLFMLFGLTTVFAVPGATAGGGAEQAIVMYTDSGLALVNDAETYIDEDKGVQPIVENGRTLVPVRFVAENLNMDVSYDADGGRVTLSGGGVVISFVIGGNTMTVNGAELPIDAEDASIAAKTVNDRTLLPLRALAEAVGKRVFYDRGLIIISDTENIYDPETDKAALDGLIRRVNVLPTVGSEAYLEELTGYHFSADQPSWADGGSVAYGPGIPPSAAPSTGFGGAADAAREAMPAPAYVPVPAPSDAGGYSETNTQVAGVDEADLVKTDGTYLYQVTPRSVVITKINPASEMRVVSVIPRDDARVSAVPLEVYVDGGKLAVIGRIRRAAEPIVHDSANLAAPGGRRAPGGTFVRCAVYDISDQAAPALERTFEVEGEYISSRKIDDIIYLISRKPLYHGYEGDPYAALYTDNGGDFRVGLDRIRYFPGFTSPGYLVISSVDVTRPDRAATVETLLGGGETVYASRGHLYVAVGSGGAWGKTDIYKFSLDDGDVTYLKKGTVEGSVLNQFSMDEYNGYFRVVTTERGDRNHLFVLDGAMDRRGVINGIAPGERIYSARFAGDRGYMVTFRQLDPLFAIDLSDPDAPRILGQLKIPGYSDYIHPIDENHLIGFGKDATNEGLYQGMKMAMFDVTDPEKPTQKFAEVIGGRGTESALLQNHRALLYAPELSMLAFPVTVREDNNYGQLTFSGAYVYRFDTEDGFALKGKISQLTEEDLLKLGNYVEYDREILRILYAGGSLITASNAKVQANALDTFVYQNSVDVTEY